MAGTEIKRCPPFFIDLNIFTFIFKRKDYKS